jgi:hypothetical protein
MYNIVLTLIDDITFKANVIITLENNVIESEVYVSTETMEDAYKCIEEIHFPNMKRNERRLKDFILPMEVV